VKVLFLSQRVPWPPDRGDRITTSHFLEHFLARGAAVRVGCLAEDDADEAAARTLAQRVAAVCAPRIDRRRNKLTSLRGLLTGEALTLPFFRSRPLMRAVRRWLAEDPVDLIWVYSSSMAQYALAHTGALRVMQFAELDSDKWLQFAARSRGIARAVYAREARLLLEFERRVARAFDVSFVVSEVERDLFRQRIPDVDPLVLPNGVDVEHFRSRGDAVRHPQTIVFTGVMDYEPNVDGVLWFAAECWPAIRRRVPDARFLVVGSKPVQRILDLQRQPGIEVTGRVPETPPYFDRAAVAIAPLRLARGVQNKVLEAMSMGLPVVSSRAAAQGLGDGAADALVIAEGSDATITAVCELLEDPPRALSLGARAARFVREHFRWEEMYRRLDAVIDPKLAARKDGRP
jgi:sugar transferase (PEP-CTERM/EpsH1 system associated)